MSVAETAPASRPIDPEERARARLRKIDAWARWTLPIGVLVLTVLAWDWVVVTYDIKHFILPRPGLVYESLSTDFSKYLSALGLTVQITLAALALAVVFGVGLAVLFTQSRLVEMSLYPYAVVLQVTPVVSIAPLIFIYVESKVTGLLICAWIVAFFPVLSNTTLGLNSVDHNLRDLFRIYGANRWQRLRYLQLPAALPYFLGGLRIAGGLSLIGAVVAELVAGSGGIGVGLAGLIQESGYRLNIAGMFAALLLIAMTGLIIFALLSLLSHLLLRKWHESAISRET